MAGRGGGKGPNGLDHTINVDLEMYESADGSDRDLEDLAALAAEKATEYLYEKSTNEGMRVMAEMIEEVIQGMAENMVEGDEPDPEPMFEAIAGVHSSDTARSCMSEGIYGAYTILATAYRMMVVHEAMEFQPFPG